MPPLLPGKILPYSSVAMPDYTARRLKRINTTPSPVKKFTCSTAHNLFFRVKNTILFFYTKAKEIYNYSCPPVLSVRDHATTFFYSNFANKKTPPFFHHF
jgi:hypothetical protein